jgi:hypothetical protein
LLGAVAPSHVFADNAAQIFATPAEAVTALGRATAATNQAVLGTIFGDAAKQLVNPDTVQGASELMEFAAAFNVTNRLVRESDTRMVLEIGAQAWPFPIPLVKVANGWQFDTAAGTEELLNRRIGRNELDVLRVLRACGQAQREYASRDRDGDSVLEYAQRLLSTPGQTDGLYWRFDLNGEVSPLGPLVAYAHGEGYGRNARTSTGPRPFHGYFFKMLASQGKHAPGGKYDYVINGNMIGGFAFVAWPAEYGESGVMTFIVNQQGRIYQRDLGVKTARTVKDLRAYDPDGKWQISAD